jgi:midasin (ATPase involved in ribosome maturation)
LDYLLRLWFHIASLLNEEHLDPSFYSVFRDILEEWTAQTTAPGLIRFVNQVRSELQSLSNSVLLSTGMSMFVIWESVHPIVPSTLEQWKVYDQLIALMNEFESRVAFRIGICLSWPSLLTW